MAASRVAAEADNMLYEESQYLRILNLYTLVIEALRQDLPSDDRLVDGLWLVNKLFLHAGTGHWLSKGTHVTQVLGRRAVVFDWASVTVLVRAALECFLAYYYVFIQPQTEDDFEFRYVAWKLSGLSQRERFPAQSAAAQAQLAQERELNAALRERIKRTSQFQHLSDERKRGVLKGKRWRLASWPSIAESAGLGQTYSYFLYGYLSSYVHSDSLSALQIAQAEPQAQEELLRGALGVIMVVLSKMIDVLAKQFPHVEPILDEHPGVARLVRKYVTAVSLLE